MFVPRSLLSYNPSMIMKHTKNFSINTSGFIVRGWNSMTSNMFTCFSPAVCRVAWVNLWRLRGSAGTECIVLSLNPAGPPTPDLCTHHISHTHLVFWTVPRDSSADRLTTQHVLRAAEGPRADGAAWEECFLKGMSPVKKRKKTPHLYFVRLRRLQAILVNMHQTES